MKLAIGDKAPNFEINNQNGEIVKLSDFKGKKLCSTFTLKTKPQVVLQNRVI